ncbi:amino acid adenylation domain-containing protein [Paenibacillus mucilaginosus]|uniref:amino acid adenylation domain-containing protein n=1 Tax=Paenibacillus mucilaginosus TaxID=61624 RepID=UPI003D23EF4F
MSISQEIRQEVQKVYPLTPMQEGMLYHAISDHETQAYFQQTVFTVTGDLEIDLFERSVHALFAKYEAFRSNFVHEKLRKPRQVVLSERIVRIPFEDISGMAADQRQRHEEDERRRVLADGFDLTTDPLFGFRVLQTAARTYRVICTYHHILMDGWCLAIILEDLFAFYRQLAQGEPVRCEPAPSFSDYIKWLGSRDHLEAGAFWKNYLSGYDGRAALPRAGRERTSSGYRREEYKLTVGAELTQKLSGAARDRRVTLSAVMQTLWGVILQRYNRTDDVVFGTVVSGRRADVAEIDRMVGLFINTIPVRVRSTGGTQTFTDLVRMLHDAMVTAEDYSYYPLYELQASSGVGKGIVDHIMGFDNFPLEHLTELVAAQADFSITEIETFENTNYDFNIAIYPGTGMTIKFIYNANKYPSGVIERIAGHLLQAIRTVAENPDIEVQRIDILTDDERHQIVHAFNATHTPYPEHLTAHEWFEEQVLKTPEKEAIVFESRRITYRELNASANRLARVLRRKGVVPGCVVGVLFDRSPEAVITMLAVGKAGGAFLPLDPSYPRGRIQFMLEDSQVPLVVTHSAAAAALGYGGETPFEVICLDHAPEVEAESDENLDNLMRHEDLIYQIYTSGSTGLPKGVMIKSGSFVNLINYFSRKFEIGTDTRLLLISSFCFDLSMKDLFAPLVSGGCVHLFPPGLYDYLEMSDLIERERITLLNCTPTAFRPLIDLNEDNGYRKLESLRYAIIGGEPVHLPQLLPWLQSPACRSKLFNNYGPTECTDVVCFYEVTDDDIAELRSLPIGSPLDNTHMYILGPHLEVLPVGVPGEICIGGIGLGKGYYNRPELTEEKFIAVTGLPDPRVYRTGDLACWLPDGNVEFLGRLDHQVKIRGIRIELGEIEERLLRHEALTKTVVSSVRNDNGSEYLCAYYAANGTVDGTQLAAYLKSDLPDHMVPVYWVRMDEMPLSPSGKIDRKRLPDPFVHAETSTNFVPPSSETEKQLAELWKEMLGIGEVGVHDRFFALGGHSILMMQLSAQIAKRFEVGLTVSEFLKHDTIAELAAWIDSPQEGDDNPYPSFSPNPEHGHVPFPLSPVQMAYYMGRHNRFEMGGISTHGYFEIVTTVAPELLSRALQKVIDRHPMMRVVVEDGLQRILPRPLPYRMDIEDLRDRQPEEREARLDRERERMAHAVLQPDQWPLYEFKAFRLSDETSCLCVGFDPIVADAASMHAIGQELLRYCREPELELPELAFTYRDYILACEAFKLSPVYEADRQYWMGKLESMPPAPDLPLKLEGTSITKPRFARHREMLDIQAWESLKQQARRHNITPSALLGAAYAEVLALWSGRQRFALNLTVFNRHPFHEEVGHIVGDFTTLLLLSLSAGPEEPFWERAKQVHRVTLEALEHRHFDGVELIREYTRVHGLGTKAAMPVVFTSALFDASSGWYELGQVRREINQTSQVYLDNQVMELGGTLSVTWDYVEDLFEPEVIEAMFRQYTALLRTLAHMGETAELQPPAADLELISRFNRTEEEATLPATLHGLFEQQALRTPEAAAVLLGGASASGGTARSGYTYRELQQRSARIARYLRGQGIGRGDTVAVLAERRPETAANVLGVLKAGAAYVPVDPQYPVERRQYILANAGCRLLLEADLYERERLAACELADDASGEERPEARPEDLAYIIYTSGSTGQPKGVAVRHDAAVNTIVDINRKFKVGADDRLLGLSSMGFDLSVYDLFGALAAGAALVMVPDHRDMAAVLQTVETEGITVWNSVPALMELALDAAEPGRTFRSLRTALLSGDWIPLSLPDKLRSTFPQAEVISLGGATEAAVWSIYYPVGEVQAGWTSIPYGRPLANQTWHVLSEAGRLCPVGVEGELYIGGRGLAEGYQGDPGKTAEAFISHPELGRLYRTGDYGVLRREGVIEFRGRKDQQVKLRGYRIELGEIQSRLSEHPAVRQAVVIDRSDESGKPYLCAYIVQTAGNSADLTPDQTAELKQYLRGRLPEYMVPAFFIGIAAVPLTSNGKIDRRALPEPMEQARETDSYAPPRNDMERKLAAIWEEILELSGVGIHDSFFELGGHSLLMVQAATRISRELNVKVGFLEFLEHDTVAGLSEWLAKRAEADRSAGMVEYPPGTHDAENLYEPFPLTEIQMAYLMGRDEAFEMGGVATHGYVELETLLDIQRFNRALQKVIDRHPMMRAIILPDGTQRLLEHVPPYLIEVEDAGGLNAAELESRIAVERARMSHAVFETDRWPLFEFKALKLGEGRYYLFIGFDLLIADGASMQIIRRELSDYYREPELELPPLGYTFRDYLLAYKAFKQTETYERDRGYWLDQLEAFPSAPQLPMKQDPLFVGRPRFERVSRTFSRDAWEVLKRLSQQHGVTPSALLCTAYAEVLAYWSGQTHLAVNLTVFNRYPFHDDVQRMVGDFTSVMLLDIRMDGASDFWTQARRVQKTLMEALEHRHYEGVEFIRELSRHRRLAAQRAVMPYIFTSMLFDEDLMQLAENGIDWSQMKLSVSQTSQVYLDHQAAIVNGELSVSWDYVEELFEPGMIEAMFRQYTELLQALAQTGETAGLQPPAADLELISRFNRTEEAILPATLHGMFEQQALRTPDAAAIVLGGASASGDTARSGYTYRELQQRSARIARYLRGQGIGRGDTVAVLAERRPETAANVLGVLKAGAAYVPVDPQYPVERRQYILENAGCRLLLEADLCERERLAACELADDASGEEMPEARPEDLAYIIYTSGSTGQPKGVAVRHDAAVNTIVDINRKFKVGADDRLLGLSSMGFDLSVYDLFGALAAGAALVMVPDHRDMKAVLQTVETEGITVWNSVPALMELALDAAEPGRTFRSLRTALLSGDWITLSLPDKLRSTFPQAEVVSLGGATEAAIWSIYYPVGEVQAGWSSIPYGRPLANQTWHVLSEAGRVCPVGVEGELYIGGRGLAEGYQGDPGKTAEAFISHPELGRLYRTGDYGVLRREGVLEFRGRKDQQVKLRGYRIELGEIQSRLSEHPAVRQAVVIDRSDESGKKYLCAYIVQTAGNSADLTPDQTAELKQHLRDRLPEYMMPAFFIGIAAVPLTANGKIDRRSLPEPMEQARETDSYAPPRNDIERSLASIWQEILDIHSVGIHDSFFELGGHSLLMVQAVTRISRELNVKVGFLEFVERDTIAQLGEWIAIRSVSGNSEPAALYAAGTPDAASLYDPFPLTEIQMAYLMGRDAAFEMGGVAAHGYVELETPLDMQRLNRALQKVIDRHPLMRAVILPDGTQRILEQVPPYVIEVEDAGSLNAAELESRMAAERERMSHAVFETDRWPLFEFKALKLGEGRYYLFIGFDLLIADGASMRIIRRELSDYYREPELELPPLGYTFRDYLLAYKAFKQTETYERDRRYWLDQLETFPSAPQLPLRQDPQRVGRPRFERVSRTVTRDAWDRLKRLSQQHGVTPSALLCTAYAEVLAYWSGQAQLAVNLTVFNRYPFHDDVERMVGDFTSSMLLGIRMDAGCGFWTKARGVQKTLMEALEHRHYEGVEFIRELSRHRRLGTQRAVMPVVFTSMLLGETAEERIAEGIDWSRVTRGISQTSQVYIDHQAMDTFDGGVALTWDYVDDLFERQMIEAMFEHYTGLLADLSEADSSVELKPPVRDVELLEQFNRTEEAILPATLHGLFEQQAMRTPDAPAIVLGGPAETVGCEYTYRELLQRSARIARYLRGQVIGRGDTVAVLAERRPETAANVLGVLKAGAAYVPVDPQYPLERRQYILANAGCRLLLEADLYERERLAACELADDASGEEMPEARPEDLAYIIYTSGSTGQPKGVAVRHDAAVNTIVDINRKFKVGADDRLLGLSSMGFDLSVYDLFGALAAGAALVMVPDHRDMAAVLQTVETEGITVWNSVPALMGLALDAAEPGRTFRSLRTALLSGDWIPLSLPDKLRSAFPQAEVVSLGGATEAAIWSIYYPVGEVQAGWTSIPYGRPLANQTWHVLNDAGRVCPVGVEGELYIGGRGLAEGYQGDPGKTAEAFISHPELGRLYRTGDYGVLRREGVIEFRGRKDQQVKLRGYRIELGEIQSRLNEHPAVRQAVVIDRSDESGKKYLCAYIVQTAGNSADLTPDQTAELKQHLHDRLPEYMVPAFLVGIADVPLTANGKIDRKALPEPAAMLAAGTLPPAAPSQPIEHRLQEIWAELLKSEAIGVHDSFFDLGGDSLQAQQLINRMESRFGVRVPIRSLFAEPTIARLADLILGEAHEQVEHRSRAAAFAETGKGSAVRPSESVYYWSPAAAWEKRQDRLIIGSKTYSGGIVHLFPELYFMAQKGVTLRSLNSSFPGVGESELQRFADELIGTRVLINSPLTPQELFASQTPLVENRYGDGLFTDEEVYKRFKSDQLTRSSEWNSVEGLALEDHEPYLPWAADRQSHREFDESTLVSFRTLSGLLSIFRQRRTGDDIRYYYASAGGLYPIDVYVYVKKDRVERLSQGLYYYEPAANKLHPVDSGMIGEDAHYFSNRNLFRSSAFSVFFLYNAEASMPRYGGMGYYLAALDTGIMVQALTQAACMSGIGLCSVGDMNSSKIMPMFRSGRHTLLMHTVEGGWIRRGDGPLSESTASADPAVIRQEAQADPRPKADAFPVSSAQKRLFLVQKMSPMSTGYNAPSAVLLEGKLDRGRFAAALRQIIARHEALRTSFLTVEGEPVQVVHPTVDLEITCTQAALSELDAILHSFVQPFDLTKAPLMRAALVQLEDEKHVLLFDMHHIIADGTSGGILASEFALLYSGSSLPKPPRPYRDYAAEQQQLLGSAEMKRHEAYWLSVFSGPLPVLKLPLDKPRPAMQSFRGSSIGFAADLRLTRMLKQLASQNEATLFMVLLAAYKVLLARLGGQEDVIVGTPIAGRQHADWDGVIGMFAGTAALRSYPEGNKTFESYLREVKEAAIGAFEHQDYPFEELVGRLGIIRDFSRNPLFDTAFALQNMEVPQVKFPQLSMEPYPFDKAITRFDLRLEAAESEEGIAFTFEYCTDLFHQDTIRKMADSCIRILEAVTSDPSRRIRDIALVDGETERRISEQFSKDEAQIVIDFDL